MDTITLITAGFSFVAATAATYAIAHFAMRSQQDPLEKKLEGLVKPSSASEAPGLLKDEELAAELRAKLRGFAEVLLSLNHLFEQAGVHFTLRSFAGITLLAAMLGAAAAVIAQVPALLVMPVVVAAGASPLVWLIRRRKCRLDAFAEQLPDALEMLARALRAGNSLPASLRIIASESLPPLAQEFAIVSESLNMGLSADRALEALEQRVPNRELRFFTTCIRVQQRSGGNLAELLEKISETVRSRFRMLGQVQALTAEGRMTGVILMLLPVVIFGVVYYINPGYLEPLFKDPTGWQITLGMVGLQMMGALAIKKIVAIKI